MRGLALLLSALLGALPGRTAWSQPARAQAALYPDREWDGTLGGVLDLAFSPDGRLLAAVGPRGFGIWDAQTGNPVRSGSVAAGTLRRAAFGGQGNLLGVAGTDGRVYVVDLRTGQQREAVRHEREVTSLAFGPDEQMAASGDVGGEILLWDPGRGVVGRLRDEGHRKEVVFLAFAAGGSLVSLGRDLQVITWDVGGRRPLRKGTLQPGTEGRGVVPDSADVDPTGTTLAVAAQYVLQSRGGALTARRGMALPEDLKRINVLMPYAVATGLSGDPVACGDFRPREVALAPAACFAFFTSDYRDQPRLHVWGLVEKGDDLLRLDLEGQPGALALDPGGRMLAVGFASGRIRTWRVSGVTAADCEAYRRKGVPAAGEPRIALGTETEPLVPPGAGYRVAVLRFEPGGVEGYLADAVRDMVAGELSNSPHVAVVERSAIEAIVKEMEIQRSGLTAADAVRIGRGLNARKVVFGSVSRFGEKTFVILARVVDVETQQVEGTRQVTCENCGEQDLPRAVGALRQVIVR